MKTVYLVNKSSHDYSGACEYGRLHPLTEGNVNLIAVDRLLYTLQEQLQHSSPDDLVLLSGHPVVNSLAVLVMMSLHEQVNLLIHDVKQRRYHLRTLYKTQLIRKPDMLVVASPN